MVTLPARDTFLKHANTLNTSITQKENMIIKAPKRANVIALINTGDTVIRGAFKTPEELDKTLAELKRKGVNIEQVCTCRFDPRTGRFRCTCEERVDTGLEIFGF